MKHFFTGLLFVVIAAYAQAQSRYFNTDGVAIRGYDPVAYFTENKPVEGSKNFSYKWDATEWHFKDQKNLEAFKANPQKYAPQFGGWCAYGVSEDHKSPTEADAFTVVNDKLYLNYNTKVKELWSKDRDERIRKAETNWVGLQQESQLNLEDGLAIEGYDPVAYFTSKKAVKGKKDFQFQHHGGKYYFSSAANRDAFSKNPSMYEPQYGGWCAYAMGETGEKVEIDPETFKILDGKLYLFYNAYFNNTLPKWNKDEANLKGKADKNWKTIINK
ncbi:MAG TPA: YHS domain-containing (seleno)protein [Cyclobacteriaceae bacterium]|nr:YHS domain-containing (seleno)protein [Cyclobacteriaceae bacterium]